MAEPFVFPKGFLTLVDVETFGLEERTVLFVHTLMLDVGFVPKNAEEYDVYERMPENWRGRNVYQFSYYHKTIPYLTCSVTCFCVYSNLVIYGLLADETEEKNTVEHKIKVTDPTNSKLCDQTKLANNIKDQFCFPLLTLLQERGNIKPLFGFKGLNTECKLAILGYLRVGSLIALSKASKDLYNLAQTPCLWRGLFKRDFRGYSIHEDSSGQVDWKENYKEAYVDWRRREERRAYEPRRPPFFDMDQDINCFPARHYLCDPTYSERYDIPMGPDDSAYCNMRRILRNVPFASALMPRHLNHNRFGPYHF